jgi:hypothetical protein
LTCLLALPLAAAPGSPPKLDPPADGTQLVLGHAEYGLPVRVKIFDTRGGLVQQRDVFADLTDSSLVIGFKTPLEAGQIVQACYVSDSVEIMPSAPVPVAGPTEKPAAAAAPVPAASSSPPADNLDLGRVRYYFTSGVILSSDRAFQLPSSGTQAGLFLGLNADRSWLPLDGRGFRRLNLNSYFDVRLTTVSTQTAATDAGTLASFNQSQKAAALESGVYLPWIVGEPWQQGSSGYSVFVAPLAKAGFTTLVSGPSTNASDALAITDGFFKSYSYGARLGVFEHFASRGAAPRIVSSVDITVGRFGDFEAFRDLTLEKSGTGSAATHEFSRVRPWRYSFEGLLKVPRSPFVLGFDANLGMGAWPAFRDSAGHHPYAQPRDDLRFLLGAQFDFSKLLRSLPQL